MDEHLRLTRIWRDVQYGGRRFLVAVVLVGGMLLVNLAPLTAKNALDINILVQKASRQDVW